jgi:phosphatidylserine/phosphatidylglycerophosphate/cardiolipin synthase-like enzyme
VGKLKQKKKKFIYPWRDANSFTLLINSEHYFSQLLNLIQRAEHYIVIEQYLVESGRITEQLIDSLVEAAARKVTVLLLFDDFGSAGLNKADRGKLNKDNIQLIFYNPVRYRKWYSNLNRDHRKFVIIDNKVGLTGGAGFTDEFDTVNNPAGWHDIMLQATGPVLNDWLVSFINIWKQYAAVPEKISDANIELKTEGQMPGRLVVSQPPAHHEIIRSLINKIQHSKKHVWLATPYFVTTRKLRRELRRAAQRNVDVRLLLPNNRSDHPWVTQAFHNYYDKLLRSGVRIFEYQPRFIHAKIICCDQWVSIGSSNLDRWNRRWSLDANQEIDNPLFYSRVEQFFNDDFSQSNEIKLTEWRKRGWIKRLRERFWKQVVVILEMLGSSYRR